jgi:hypothetical protein
LAAEFEPTAQSDLTLNPELAVLSPQSVELLALRSRQAAVATPRIALGLRNPVPDRLSKAAAWFARETNAIPAKGSGS